MIVEIPATVDVLQRWHDQFPHMLDRMNQGEMSIPEFERFMEIGDSLASAVQA